MGLVIPIFIAHQGCPHQCLFCNQHAISATPRDTDERPVDITCLIDEWLNRSPNRLPAQVAFYGGSFTCLDGDEQMRMLQAVAPYIRSGQVGSIRLSTRPDCITADIAEHLRSCGVETVEVGVQSLDDTVLKKALRGHTAMESIRAVKTLKAAGLTTGVQLLPGLPGEGTSSFFRTVETAISLKPDFVRIYPAVVVKGSSLARMFTSGLYSPLSLNRAIALTYRARTRFRDAGIEVVRMGLQPSAELERQLLAGPYHPAFGELVISRDWFCRIRSQLAQLKDGQRLHIHISSRDHSSVVGMKRMNMKRLDQLGYTGRYTVYPEKERKRGSVEYVVS